MHQLPPVIHVIMVAVDEASVGRRLQGIQDVGSAADAMGIRLSLFQNAGELESDLRLLTDGLNDKKVAHRIFRTDVLMRGGQWSD